MTTVRRLRVAVADDERDTREYLQEVLPRLGHEVVAVAANGKQLVEQCHTLAPDLVVTDIKMPDLDGLEVATLVNRQRPTAVILLSAHHDETLLSRLAATPVMGYLVKPIQEPDLKTAIALAMPRFQQFQALAKEAADLRQALEDRKLIEKAKGIVMKRLRVEEDEAFRRLRKMASDHNLKLAEAAQQVVAADDIFRRLDRG